MAHFLFIDESGQDHRESPYEVLAGITIEDRDLWNVVQAIQEAEIRHFGTRYSKNRAELKGKKLLNRKVFRLAAQLPTIPIGERSLLAKKCLEDGANATKQQLTALAQAKIAYVREVFEICARFRCKAFASIVDTESLRPIGETFLRKDYSYLFERFYYFLEDQHPAPSGIIVFDELEKTNSHLLLQQMDTYFKSTQKGRLRSGLVVPEPFFVHSELTTGIQIADLIAYTLSWGFRTSTMDKPPRTELADFVSQLCQIRYRTTREVDGNPSFTIWSFAWISNLQPKLY